MTTIKQETVSTASHVLAACSGSSIMLCIPACSCGGDMGGAMVRARALSCDNPQEELCQMEESLQQDLITIRNGPNVPKEIEIIRRQHK